MTGMLPSQHGLIQYPRPGRLRSDIPTLAEILEAAGYVTLGLHGGGFVDEQFGLGRGFMEYQTHGRRFEHNLRSCLRWIRWNRKWPFFLFWHGFDCHMPYDPPAHYDRFDSEYSGDYDVTRLFRPDGDLPENEADHQHIIARYDGEIAYSDSVVGTVLAELERLQILNQTLIVVLSDHGEEFKEHGSYDHTRTLYDELVHVPLIVKLPARHIRRKVDELISFADLAPMICEWIGLEFPLCHGKTLSQIAKLDTEYVFAETGYRKEYLEESAGWEWQHKPNRPQLLRTIQTQRWKLVIDQDDKPAELYDREVDELEQNNILDESSEKATDLLSVFQELGPGTKGNEIVESTSEMRQLDEAVIKRLQDLGYF
jgi:arylsulfatase A-like enzyme